jgi:hypothetical protein
MLLAQSFKTFERAHKRALFETRLSTTHNYIARRQEDKTYRIEKTKRIAPALAPVDTYRPSYVKWHPAPRPAWKD